MHAYTEIMHEKKGDRRTSWMQNKNVFLREFITWSRKSLRQSFDQNMEESQVSSKVFINDRGRQSDEWVKRES